MSVVEVKVPFGDGEISIQTGKLAKQANSVVVRKGDTMVLVTAVASKDAKEGIDFLPLTVDYLEKAFSAGKIPGGFFKREGRPTEKEILTSRLIDRPIRPLFPEGWNSEIQIVATVLSADLINDPQTLAIIGASAALTISEIPFLGPIAGCRVSRVDGKFVLNAASSALGDSDIDMIVAASKEAVVMVEGGASEASERDVIDAIMFAHQSLQPVIAVQEALRQQTGSKAKREAKISTIDPTLISQVKTLVSADLQAALRISEKHVRYDAYSAMKEKAVAALVSADDPDADAKKKLVKTIIEDLKHHDMRHMIVDQGIRIDGRDTKTVRPISSEVSILPRAHGSALFTRGETQALVTTTLGSGEDEQRIDEVTSQAYSKKFMLHYNFPAFSVGEVKPLRSPGRREIGHGALAERAISKVLPTPEEFPGTIRIVSEILESNGSSSMASICGGILSLMDAGVPIKAPVAGIAMGLIKEGDKCAILTDILGDEDHLGDMDFKIAGTVNGVTAVQMDIKISGIDRHILETALEQARVGRLHILGEMAKTMATHRAELPAHAPRMKLVHIRPEKIKDVIGSGGSTIRKIVEESGAKIDIEDDGSIQIFATSIEAMERAVEMIEEVTAEAKIGKIYQGKVRRIVEFGAFVEILPKTDGLVHISQLADRRVERVEDILQEGDRIPVKVIEIDRQGKIRLSLKEALKEQAEGKGTEQV